MRKYLIFLFILFQSCNTKTTAIESENFETVDKEIFIPKNFSKIDSYDPPDFLGVYVDCTNDVDSMIIYQSLELDSTYIFLTYFKPAKFQESSSADIKSSIIEKLIYDLGNTQDYLNVVVTDNYIYDEYYIKIKDFDYRLKIVDRSARIHLQLESLSKENIISEVLKVRNELIKENPKVRL